jgi:branched-subunit amino acid transport protein
VTWAAILVGASTCYLIKLAGLSVPERILRHRRVRHMADLLPVALLAALVATQTFSQGQHLSIDARAAGLASAAAAQLLRAPFIVVVVVAVATTALVRLAL